VSTVVESDGIRRLSVNIDPQMPVTSPLKHPIERERQAEALGTSSASFWHYKQVLWQVGLRLLSVSTVVESDGIRRLSVNIDPQMPVTSPLKHPIERERQAEALGTSSASFWLYKQVLWQAWVRLSSVCMVSLRVLARVLFLSAS